MSFKGAHSMTIVANVVIFYNQPIGKKVFFQIEFSYSGFYSLTSHIKPRDRVHMWKRVVKGIL